MEKLNLARTKAAIEKYDAANAAYQARVVETWDNEEEERNLAAFTALEEAEKGVGEAFAADTGDRNDPETARRQLPDTWLRALVAKYG